MKKLSCFFIGCKKNTVNGNYSAILGGSGNNDNGIPFTGMFGNGLVATVAVPGAPSTFWVDSLVGPNIPLVTTAGAFALLPIGALYRCNTSSIIGQQPLFIK